MEEGRRLRELDVTHTRSHTHTKKHTYMQPYAHIQAHIQAHMHTYKHTYMQPYAKLGGKVSRPRRGGTANQNIEGISQRTF